MSLRERLPSLVRSFKPVPDISTYAIITTTASALRANKALAARVAVAAATMGVAPLLLWRAATNYRAWLALDAGGLPYNPLGYLVNALMRPLARFDTRVPAPYNRATLEPLYGREAFVSYFDGGEEGAKLPYRAGPRPDVPTFVAPQRQMTQGIADGDGAGLRARQVACMEALARANPDAFKTAPSEAEGRHHGALWLADGGAGARGRGRGRGVAGLAWGLRGEFAHPHGEGSAHLVLSLADAETLIARGWAERHPLSGGRGPLPWGYVFVYAPRDDDEFALWCRVLLASARFVAAASGWEGKVIVPEEM